MFLFFSLHVFICCLDSEGNSTPDLLGRCIRQLTVLEEKQQNYKKIINSLPPPTPSYVASYKKFYELISCDTPTLKTLQFHAARLSAESDPVEYLVPVTLVCNAFANYVNLFESTGVSNIPLKFRKTACEMVAVLNSYNDSEATLRQNLESILREGCVFPLELAVKRIKTNAYETDISVCAAQKEDESHCMANIELKLHLGATNLCPELENVGYFYNMKTHFMFCIVICGWSHFEVFGAARLKCDEKDFTIVMPLASSFPLRYIPYYGKDEILLARSLFALSESFSSWRDIVWKHRDVPHLLEVLPKLEGMEFVSRLLPGKLLFNAQKSDGSGSLKLVKFVLRNKYGIDVHKALHKQGLAPAAELVHCNPLWSAVVMDFVDGKALTAAVNSCEFNDDSIKRKICRQLDQVVVCLKQNKFRSR